MVPAYLLPHHSVREHPPMPSKSGRLHLKREAAAILPPPSLTVYSISGKGWRDISETAKTWEIKARQILKGLHPENEHHSLVHNLIDHCQTISELTAKGPLSDHALLTCQHGVDVFAIAIFNHKTNHLVHIVSNPRNLIGASRIKEAPTKIMLCLANHIRKNRATLTAKINDASTDFFCKKFQFSPAEELTPERDLESRTPTVKLTADKIAELIRKRVPPFDQL